MKKINVAVVGLNFGAQFVPCYRFHPNVGELTICDLDRELVRIVGDQLGIKKRYYDLKDVLADQSIDAVHLLTNIPDHSDQAVAVMNAGKHCACAVPMSLTTKGVQDVLEAQKQSGKKYMLMETIVFSRNFLLVQDMSISGELGRIQYIKGFHYQDMEGWPSYWAGLPPMLYGSHALAPAFSLLQCGASEVVCFGSGVMREQLRTQYGNPYPMQSAFFMMEDDTLVEVTRTLFYNARGYTEGFCVGGDLATFETGQLNSDQPVLFRYMDAGSFDPTIRRFGRDISESRICPPDRLDLLPPELHCFTQEHLRASLEEGGGVYTYQPGPTGGHHPHVVHSFVEYVAHDVPPFFEVRNAAKLTIACICAHESSMKGGQRIQIQDRFQ